MKFVDDQVSFQRKNPDFLLRNPDFLLKNVDFIIKQPAGGGFWAAIGDLKDAVRF